jgi:hypothetical protein
VCQIDRLQRKSYQQAREAIKCLPQTLEETYEIILLEIPQDDWPTVQTALLWIIGYSDMDDDRGIAANCLCTAVLNAKKGSTSDIIKECHEHEFLKELLGCLVEVTSVTRPRAISTGYYSREYCFQRTGRGHVVSSDPDADDICLHVVSLAHYTIEEFLFSDRIKKSRASDFAMSRNICAQRMLETVLQQTTDDQYTSTSPLRPSFDLYCHDIAHCLPTSWQSHIIQNEHLRKWHYLFSIKHNKVWQTNFQLEGKLTFVQTDDSTTLNTQYLIMLIGSELFELAEKFLEEISLETVLSTSTAFKENRIGYKNLTILEALALFEDDYDYLYFFQEHMGLPKLFLFVMITHNHNYVCAADCFIDKLLEFGVDVNPPGCLLTPLQIAVRNWDLEGVNTLLEHKANPNGTGQLGGYIPAHLDTTWSQCSPLHILRNAKYGLMVKGTLLELKVSLSASPFIKSAVQSPKAGIQYFTV